MNVDGMKRNLTSEVAGHHNHARYPEKDDVKTSHQY